MDDLISRAAAIEAIAIEFDECGIEYGPNEVVHRVTCELKHLPTVNAAPAKHGYWKDNGNGTVSCSCCATWFQKEREPYLLYCGYCGARMDSGRSDDNGCLISREAALEIIEAVKNVSWSQSGKVLCGKMYSQIKDLPSANAVNAIPVEWLCGYLNKIGMKPTDISEMILTWKKGR